VSAYGCVPSIIGCRYARIVRRHPTPGFGDQPERIDGARWRVDADYADCKVMAKNERDATEKRVGKPLADSA